LLDNEEEDLYEELDFSEWVFGLGNFTCIFQIFKLSGVCVFVVDFLHF
jgi:hypothetical protein